MTTLHVGLSHENVKFEPSDVIRKALCRRLSLVEYLELKITDYQSAYFLNTHLSKTVVISK